MSASKHGISDGATRRMSSETEEQTGKPVRIIAFEMRENRPSKMRLEKTVLKNILKSVGDLEIAVISIAGPSRKGKSMLMCYLVSFLQKNYRKVQVRGSNWIDDYSSTKPLMGFSFKNGTERETEGVYLWSEPFILTRSDGSEFAVLLMDTQGVFDDQTGEREWSAIIGLSMLVSSCLIYNIFTDLQEDVFVMLNTFMQQGLRTMDDDDKKCFQKLIFLIRDWNNPGQHRYGPIGGKHFIEEKLKIKNTLSKESKESRLILNQCFEEINCFLIPPPGERAKALNFKGSNQELERNFIDNIKCFVEDLLLNPNDIPSKRIKDTLMTGKSLISYFDKFVQAYNGSPQTTTFQDALIHGSCAAAEEKSIEKYLAQMKNRMDANDSIGSQDLQQFHQDCSVMAGKYFDAQKNLGDAMIVERYRNSLEANLNKAFQTIFTNYMKNRVENAKKWIDESVTTFQASLSAVLQGHNFEMEDRFEAAIDTAKENAFAKFHSKTGDENEEYFSEFVPQLIQKLDLIANDCRAMNNERLSDAKHTFHGIVNLALIKYRKKMSELQALIMGFNDLQHSTILTFHESGRAEAISKYKKLAKNKDPQLQSIYQNMLEDGILADFESFVRQNKESREQVDKSNVEILQNIVRSYSEEIVSKIDTNEICELDKLNEIHLRKSSAVKSSLSSVCNIQTMPQLQQYDSILSKEMEKVIEHAKSNLQRKHVQTKQIVLLAITSATEDYSNQLNEIQRKTHRILGDDEMNRLHKEVSEKIFKTICIPSHFNETEKAEVKSEVFKRLNGKFPEAKEQNDNKLRDAKIHVENICKAIGQDYEKQLMKCDYINITKAQIRAAQDANKAACKQTFLNEIEPFGPFVKDQFLEMISTHISEAEKRVDTFITSKQQELSVQIQRIQELSLNLYNAEMMNRVLPERQYTSEQTSANHKFASSKSIHEFENELEKKRIQPESGATFKEKLLKELELELQRRQKSNSVLMGKATAHMKECMETSFQNYKTEIDIRVKAATSEGQLKTIHATLKRETISDFITTVESIGDIGNNELKVTLGDNIQSYFENSVQDQFLQVSQQRIDAMQSYIRQAKEMYINTMNSELNISSWHEEQIVLDAHDKSFGFAMDNFLNTSRNMFSNNEICLHEDKLKLEIQKEYEAFQLKQEKVLEELTETAKFHMDKYVQEFENTCEEIFKHAKTSNHFRINLQQNLAEMTLQFLQHCSFPLETTFKRQFHQKLEAVVTDFEEKFKEAEVRPELLKIQVDDAIVFYKTKMEELIGDNTEPIEIFKLREYHTIGKESTMAQLRTTGIRITETVESALKQALNQVFKIYMDTNSLKVVSEPVIGIDLGTTYSCVAVYTKNGVVVIPNEFGDKTTPSYVRYKLSGEVDMVGKPAKNQAHEMPMQTIFDVKRLIGRRFDDQIVQNDIKLWPFQVVADKNPSKSPQIQVGSTTFPPEKVSSEILKNLKKVAETFLNKKSVTRAVITIPAYFNDAQRQATKDAGKLAGLEVLGILNEPTAAAIAYSLQHTDEQVRNVLVYDFGGGTFDVVILKMAGGHIQVKSVGGDTHLGGEDVDSNLVDYCVSEFKRKHGIDLSALATNATNLDKEGRSRRLRRLRHHCEQRKCDLSGECSEVTITVEAICGVQDLHVNLSQAKFEELNLALFEKTIEKVRIAIEESKLAVNDIDDVVLVGGSTKIPKVQQLLQELFEGKGLRRSVNPDEAVAFGAAIHAAILNGNRDQKITLTDVTPLTLGISTKGNRFSSIIKKNTPLPTTKVEHYRTSCHHQTEVEICVYEGENPAANKNHLLGTFSLGGLPPKSAGVESLDVTMTIGTDGILNVKAVSVSTGKESEINIAESKGRLTAQELDALM